MMKILLFLISFPLFAQDFSGCGEYKFKGILKYDEKAPLKMSYIVREGTGSQMTFSLVNKADVTTLAAFIDKPSHFKAKILKPMDGTKGELGAPVEIGLRFPDPLSASDTGIEKIKTLKCQ